MQVFKMASQSDCTDCRIISQIIIQLSSYSKAYVFYFLTWRTSRIQMLVHFQLG